MEPQVAAADNNWSRTIAKANDDWRVRAVAKIATDKTCTITAVRLYLYLIVIMEMGESRFFHGGQIQKDLAIPTRAVVSLAFKALEEKGYIERIKGPNKRKTSEIRLLPV